ncbi:YiiD C-terminal domain-containing protein [Moraxella bovoculi]|uniref:YiiD C-terminal domain-containing protein n=1 Tax=Moraxella bovoculi TaxID=386891 RepID=UPI003F4F72A6
MRLLLLPYQGNTNHHQTMFGGNLSLAATLAGWAIAYENVPKVDGNIVIKSSQMRYPAPAPSDVEVVAELDDMDCQSVKEVFERFGWARVNEVC